MEYQQGIYGSADFQGKEFRIYRVSSFFISRIFKKIEFEHLAKSGYKIFEDGGMYSAIKK